MGTYLVTGVAGFIGWRTTTLLLAQGHSVVGIDNLNEYYDIRLKEARLRTFDGNSKFTFFQLDVERKSEMHELFSKHSFEAVIHLAARAGVRYSITNPLVYFSTNVNGTLILLEQMKRVGIKKMVFASTSSLYAGQEMPFKEDLPVCPISPYAVTKRSAEMLTYTYHYLFDMNITVLRYFTVYGPFGRPDMCIFRFIKWIEEEKPIELMGEGSQSRDFTYVDDIAEGTIAALQLDCPKYAVINLGGGRKPISLADVIALLEKQLDKRTTIIYKPSHRADLKETWADITRAKERLGWRPKVSLEEGLRRTVRWYLDNRDWLGNVELRESSL